MLRSRCGCYACLLVTVLLVSVASSAWAEWIEDGAPICTYMRAQNTPKIVSDGVAGAIIAWRDSRQGGRYDIYAQRLDSLGNTLWKPCGVPVCDTTGSVYHIGVTTDGAEGAIICWVDPRDEGQYDVFAQRVISDGDTLWNEDGVTVCHAKGDQTFSVLVSDGVGGAIVAWQDPRSDSADVYVQRVNALGDTLWAPDSNAVAICTAIGPQMRPEICSDGASGAIVAWVDERSGAKSVYAQRVDSTGSVRWTDNGICICDGTAFSPVHRSDIALLPDCEGGAIIVWRDNRSGIDIYAQRVSALGITQWETNGVEICTAPDDQYTPVIASDGSCGAIIVWPDHRWGNWDVYAQRVDASGDRLWGPPNGRPVYVGPGEQSGVVVSSDGWDGAVLAWVDDRNGEWDIYAQRVDSLGNNVWPDTGVVVCDTTYYQTDAAIISDAACGAIIAWHDRRDEGLHGGDIYAQRVNCSGCPGCTDVPAPGGRRGPLFVQTVPNPFRWSTRIVFSTKRAGPVRLEVFDARGRLVRVLANDVRQPGRYVEIWDGRDMSGRPVASGAYFYRLKAPGFLATRKLVLAR